MLTFLGSIFVFGSFMFWILTLSCFLILSFLVENDSDANGSTILCIGSYLAIIHWFGDASVFSWISSDPMRIVKYAVGYISLGVVWSFVRLYFKLKMLAAKKNNDPNVRIPQFSEFKSRIVGWMTYWPASMVGVLLNDIVRNTFKFIVEYLSGSYKAVYNSALGIKE